MIWVWVLESTARAIHDAQLAEHGGRVGLLEEGRLASALAHPKNLAAYNEKTDAAALAAAYASAISRNHPFVDGNKRTAFVVMELFLHLNGYVLEADDAECISAMETLAAGELSESDLTTWIRERITY